MLAIRLRYREHVSKLAIGTRVVIEGHIRRETWHLSNDLTGKGYHGRIVAYDAEGDYLVEAVIKGESRQQKVKA